MPTHTKGMMFRFHPIADSKLDEIWLWTAERWGEAQADKYIHQLLGAIQESSEREGTWRRLPDEVGENLFFIHHERHYIFFRILSDGVLGIMTILHDSMDIPTRLREDLGRLNTTPPGSFS